MIGETKIVEVAGTIGSDLSKPRARKAHHAGTVVNAKIAAGTWVRKGAWMLSVTGPGWRQIQEIYLEYRSGRMDRQAMRNFVGLTRDPEWFLGQLRLTDQQKRDLRKYKRVIDPVPILSPLTGILTQSLTTGSTFDAETALFAVSEHRLALIDIETPGPDWELDGKVEIVTPFREVPFVGQVLQREKQDEAPRLQVEIFDPEHQLGPEVSANFRFTYRWVDRAEEARRRIWPYALPPRGSEAQRLGLLPASSAFDRPKPPPPRATPASPFRVRPARSAAPFVLPTAPALPEAADHRYPLLLAEPEWRKLSISTATVQHRTVCRQWPFEARVVANPAPTEAMYVLAPLAGQCRFEPLRAHDRVSAGTIVAWITSPDLHQARAAYLKAAKAGNTKALQRAAADLQTLGHSLADLNEVLRDQQPIKPFPVIATFDGMVLDDVLARTSEVVAGQNLVRMQAFNTVLISGSLERSAFADVPARVQLSLKRPSDLSPSEIVIRPQALLPLLELHHDTRHDRVSFKIPLADAHPSLQTFDILKGVLSDPTAVRPAFVSPADCVHCVAHSHEVLVHSRIGVLTPVSIAIGDAVDDLIEVYGLPAGTHVVRDLALLQDESDQIRAILTGFWNPRQYLDNIRADALRVAASKPIVDLRP